MTVKEVAEHVGLDWKTVKKIDKEALEEEFGDTDYGGLSILAIDEISRRKGHDYLTVVLDYLTGRVVWVGEGRDEKAVTAFFEGMTQGGLGTVLDILTFSLSYRSSKVHAGLRLVPRNRKRAPLSESHAPSLIFHSPSPILASRGATNAALFLSMFSRLPAPQSIRRQRDSGLLRLSRENSPQFRRA